MATTRITATEAVRSFSDLLNRVRYRGECFVIERGGELICEMGPARPTTMTVADLADWFATLPHADAEFAADVEESTRQQPLAPESPWES